MNTNEKVYLERRINETIASLSNHLDNIQHIYDIYGFYEPHEEEYADREIDSHTFRFNRSLKVLYLMVLAYLEGQNKVELLQLYKNDLQGVLAEDFDGVQDDHDEENGQTYYISSELQKIRFYLSPFEAFDVRSKEQIGLIYLENILTNTEVIISDLKKKPNNEASVYNAVKFVIKATFPNSVFPSEPFYQTAKCYKPDILIPSLFTAVEYKYAATEKKLIDTIESIHVDVRGYANHPTYKIFYAVFYVISGACSETRFKAIWEDQNFPDDWKPVIVFGK